MKIVTISVAALGVLLAPAAIAQTKPAKATVSPQQLVCELTGDCGGSTAGGNASYKIGNEQPFSLDPNSAKPAAKTKTAGIATTPASAPIGKAGKNSLVRATRPGTNPGAKAVASRPRGPSDLQITFLVGKTDLTPVGKANADVLAGVLASPKLAGMRVRIEGHTDAQGTREMNMQLSQARANAIVDYLVSRGIPRDRLEAQGFGFDRPLPKAAPTSPANRRAVAIVIN